jgi:hypothetical protein
VLVGHRRLARHAAQRGRPPPLLQKVDEGQVLVAGEGGNGQGLPCGLGGCSAGMPRAAAVCPPPPAAPCPPRVCTPPTPRTHTPRSAWHAHAATDPCGRLSPSHRVPHKHESLARQAAPRLRVGVALEGAAADGQAVGGAVALAPLHIAVAEQCVEGAGQRRGAAGRARCRWGGSRGGTQLQTGRRWPLREAALQEVIGTGPGSPRARSAAQHTAGASAATDALPSSPATSIAKTSLIASCQTLEA